MQNPYKPHVNSKDNPFVITKVREAYRHRACRRAVLIPLIGPRAVADIKKHFDDLRRMWHASLYGMRAVNWEPILSEKNLNYMRKCPPFGVVTNVKAKCCRRSAYCPFCYARERILVPFCRMERILYGSDSHYLGPDKKLLPVLHPDRKIIAYRLVTSGTKNLPRLKSGNMPIHWNAVRKSIDEYRRQEMDVFEALYGTAQFYVYPYKGYLQLVRAGVMLAAKAPDPADVRAYNALGGRIRVYDDTNKTSLYDAFSWALRYPKGVLHCRKHNLLARLFESMRSVRMMTWYGPRNIPDSTYKKPGT